MMRILPIQSIQSASEAVKRRLVNVSHKKKMSELQHCFTQQFLGDDELHVCEWDLALRARWGFLLKGINHTIGCSKGIAK